MSSNIRIQEDGFLVSVIMLSYNHEEYIKEAIESVLSQEVNFRYQVIIHDDASLDNSSHIIREYQAHNPEIIQSVIQTENQYSKGIKFVTTDLLRSIRSKYIAFCECDDFWLTENKLQKQVDFLESHPQYIAVSHNCKTIDEYGDQPRDFIVYKKEKQHEHTIKDSLFYFHLSTVLFRNEVFQEMSNNEAAVYDRLRANGDVKIHLALLLNGVIFHCEDVMSCHRVVRSFGDSYSARNFGKNLEGIKFVASLDTSRYARRFYGKHFLNHAGVFLSAMNGVLIYLRKPTEENRQVLKDIRSETHNFVSLFLLITYTGVLTAFSSFKRKIIRLLKLR